MKQFNNKYKNVFYENNNRRFYDENTTNSFDALYSETQIKFIELIEKYNFKIFYFTNKPATKNKLIIKNNCIDLSGNDVKQIKINQSADFFYIYKNKICEVFYSFLKLDINNNYYFDFIIVVNKNFDLNSLHNYNFKSIKIVNVEEIFLEKITFNWVKSIFEKRAITLNNCVPIQDKNFYNLNKLNYGVENYIRNIKNNADNFDDEEYANFNSFFFYKQFNQHKYAKKLFSLLSSQIWSLDRHLYKEKNKHGFRISYNEIYNINSSFLTNFAELVNCFSAEINNNNFLLNKEHYTYCCLSDNTMDQGIILISFNLEYLKNKKIDFDNLKIIDKYE